MRRSRSGDDTRRQAGRWPNWWRTEAILAARLRDLVAGLDSIGAFTIPYARLPRRLATYADEFLGGQTSLTKPHRHCC